MVSLVARRRSRRSFDPPRRRAALAEEKSFTAAAYRSGVLVVSEDGWCQRMAREDEEVESGREKMKMKKRNKAQWTHNLRGQKSFSPSGPPSCEGEILGMYADWNAFTIVNDVSNNLEAKHLDMHHPALHYLDLRHVHLLHHPGYTFRVLFLDPPLQVSNQRNHRPPHSTTRSHAGTGRTPRQPSCAGRSERCRVDSPP